jgi:hypothetical protein
MGREQMPDGSGAGRGGAVGGRWAEATAVLRVG